jgi:acyl-coenzyme A thioesterase PaaI-like protein
MTSNDQIARLNEHKPPFIEVLNGKIIAADSEAQSCTFEFRPTTDHCHSINVVQGGFITVMLDAAMSHAVFAHLGPEGVVALSSLEVTTRYHAVTRGGKGPVYAKRPIKPPSWSQSF